MSADEAYEPGSPKRADYREPSVCVFCGGVAGHSFSCPEVARNESHTVDTVIGLLPTRRTDEPLVQAAKAHAARARRQSYAGLTLGQVDDHLAALRSIAADLVGGEYDTAKQAADAVLGAADDLEGEL